MVRLSFIYFISEPPLFVLLFLLLQFLSFLLLSIFLVLVSVVVLLFDI